MPNDDPDLPLINAMAAGSRDALETLYSRHGLHLLNFLIREIGERAAAEDVLQVVMLAAWNGARQFRGDSLVTTWLFAIARRQVSKTRRTRRHLSAPLDESLTAGSNSDEPDSRVEPLKAALNTLTPPEREALELVFYQGYSLNDAADHLKIPLNTLKSRLFRARTALRRLIERDHEGVDHV